MGKGSPTRAVALPGHRLVSTPGGIRLVSQIRRSASSIPSNIAEGCGREGDPELARFCIIARGSATELEYQLLLARDLKFIQPKDYEQLSAQTVEIKRMLTVLVQKLTADS